MIFELLCSRLEDLIWGSSLVGQLFFACGWGEVYYRRFVDQWEYYSHTRHQIRLHSFSFEYLSTFGLFEGLTDIPRSPFADGVVFIVCLKASSWVIWETNHYDNFVRLRNHLSILHTCLLSSSWFTKDFGIRHGYKPGHRLLSGSKAANCYDFDCCLFYFLHENFKI